MPENDPNVLLGIAGIAVGIAGIIIGIIVSTFFYFRSKNKYLMEYEVHSTQLITEKMTSIPNLKVTINDQPAESLTSTTIVFSNAGNQSIALSDFAAREPIGITIKGHLHSYDTSAHNPNSKPDLQPIDDETFHITFDFLKQKQFFTITLLHDGTVTVFGELKNGELREYRDPLAKRSFAYALSSISAVLGAIFCFIYSVVIHGGLDFLDSFLPTIGIIVLIFIPLYSELILFLNRKRAKKRTTKLA